MQEFIVKFTNKVTGVVDYLGDINDYVLPYVLDSKDAIRLDKCEADEAMWTNWGTSWTVEVCNE